MNSSTAWVTSTGYTVVEGERNVFDVALERVNHIFDLGVPVVVSFSGGKDSTSALMLALRVARERGELPLRVALVDEEVIDPDTIAYIKDIRAWDDIDFAWLCLSIKHTLRSKFRTHWYTWDLNERDKWPRDIPEGAITEIAGYNGRGSYADAITAYYQSIGIDERVDIAGIRANEAYNRRRGILTAGRYIHDRGDHFYAKPIYDWAWQDVWKAILENKWPHSAFYDKTLRAGISPANARVAPWGNVASSRYIRLYPRFYPDFWARAVVRLPELLAASRYGDTKLYREALNKPLEMTWQEYTWYLVDHLQDEDDRDYWINVIEGSVRRWSDMSSQPYPERNFKLDGKTYNQSWQRLAFNVGKNDRGPGGSSRDVM